MKTHTSRLALVALVASLAFAVLGFSHGDEVVTEGDEAVAEAWDALGGAVGNALFAHAYRARAPELGLDDGEAAVVEATVAVRAAVGNVLFAYDFRSKESARPRLDVGPMLVLR